MKHGQPLDWYELYILSSGALTAKGLVRVGRVARLFLTKTATEKLGAFL